MRENTLQNRTPAAMVSIGGFEILGTLGTGRTAMLRHFTDPVPDPRHARPDVSAEAAAICMKLMQKSPGDRYRNANRLIADLERLLPRMRSGQRASPPRHHRDPAFASAVETCAAHGYAATQHGMHRADYRFCTANGL